MRLRGNSRSPAEKSSGACRCISWANTGLDGTGAARKAAFKLTLRRGQTEIEVRQSQDNSPADMPRLVRQTAAEMLSKARARPRDHPTPRPKSGNWSSGHGSMRDWETGRRPWR